MVLIGPRLFELDVLPKFSWCSRSSLNGDGRVGEEKLAEQRKKEDIGSEIVQLHRRLAEMVGGIYEWLFERHNLHDLAPTR